MNSLHTLACVTVFSIMAYLATPGSFGPPVVEDDIAAGLYGGETLPTGQCNLSESALTRNFCHKASEEVCARHPVKFRPNKSSGGLGVLRLIPCNDNIPIVCKKRPREILSCKDVKKMYSEAEGEDYSFDEE